MVRNIKDNGLIIKCMGLENTNGKMVELMKAIIIKI
jgi:hypothetical protein